MSLKIDVLSLFPHYLESPLSESMLKRAQEKGLLVVNLVNIRDYSTHRYHQVDDRPFGGGPGMVLMPEPVVKGLRDHKSPESKTIYLSPQGNPLTSKKAEELSKEKHLILLCGHYEGIDERVLAHVDEEISIGDYVLTNGCLAALVLIDALSRFIPGVLGHMASALQDSFESGTLEHPQYTRPQEFEGQSVPEVLLSGDHRKISEWRKKMAYEQTLKERPDLIKR